MAKMLPKPPIIKIDTREQQPWSFVAPFKGGAIHGTVRDTIEAGDYTIFEVPNLVIIERKKSFAEIYANFIPKENHERFEREFEKLKDYKFKYIIVEQTWDALFKTETFKYLHKMKYSAGTIVMKNLLSLMNKYNVHVIAAGNTAEQTATTILLKHYNDYASKDLQ